MELRVDGAFIYFTLPFFGGIPVTQTMVSSIVVTVLLCGSFVYLGRNLSTRPDSRQVLAEKGVMLLRNMVAESMGEHNVHWMPFIGTIFLSSICGSLIGLTGFFRSTTADLSTTLVWSLMVTAVIWYQSIRNRGFPGWLKGFAEPIAVMTPMNIISEIAQPVSMAFRHFGSIAGGGVVTALIYTSLSLASNALLNLIAGSYLAGFLLTAAGIGALLLWQRQHRKRWLILGLLSAVPGLFGFLQSMGLLSGVPILALGLPGVLSCYFDLFSGFVQAYVFTLLTMVYIGNALPAGDEAMSHYHTQ